MKQEAIVFVDVDESATTLYTYREPHFISARKKGLACLSIVKHDRQHLERVQQDSDETFFLDNLGKDQLSRCIANLQSRYTIRALFCHAGHSTQEGNVWEAVSELCQEMHLPCAPADSLAFCNNKFLMRQVLQDKGVCVVRHGWASDEESLYQQANLIGYPLIAKPPFGAASAFVKKCSDWDELKSHYDDFKKHYRNGVSTDKCGSDHDTLYNGIRHRHTPGETLLLEEYIQGPEGSVECLVTDQNVYPILVNEKLILTEKNDTVLENLLITPPASFSTEEIHRIKSYAQSCISAIGLKNAIVHFEFRLGTNGPVVIEINPRLGGLYVNAAFMDIAGIDPYDWYLSALIGEQNTDEVAANGSKQAAAREQCYAMLALYPEHSGYLKEFRGINWLNGVQDILEFSTYPVDSFVRADSEENFIMKCWAKVEGKSQAISLYDEVITKVKPIIEIQTHPLIDETRSTISRKNYCHVKDFYSLFHDTEANKKGLCAYWERLELDQNFKDYTHRERRILRYFYNTQSGLSINKSTQYQSGVNYKINYKQGPNQLSYAEDSFIKHPTLNAILEMDIKILGHHLQPDHDYTIDIHLFRIRADAGRTSPTTSGIHQDGQDWVFMHFIQSHNIHPVISEIHNGPDSRQATFSTQLTQFLETIIVNDKAIYHSANAVRPIDPNEPAYLSGLACLYTRLTNKSGLFTCHAFSASMGDL